MKFYQICTILIGLWLIPSILGGDSTENLLILEEEFRNDPSPQNQLLVYAIDSLLLAGREYTDSSLQVCRNVMKEETLLSSNVPEAVEFKDRLKMFIEKYDTSSKDIETTFNLLQEYAGIFEKYFKMPENQMTPNAKFIFDILNKHRTELENINARAVKKFHLFVEEFSDMFARSKEHMDTYSLEWFDKFKTYTIFGERFRAIMDYIIAKRTNFKNKLDQEKF